MEASPGFSPALHVRGVVLPEGGQRDLYIVDGHLVSEPVRSAQTVAEGWVVPGLVDAHCHLGLGPEGGVDRAETERQALAARGSGMLLARDCGSPVDTRWLDTRADLPRVIRAGRHLARPRRYIRGLGLEVTPDELPAAAEEQASAGDGWVKIVVDWIDRDTGDLAPCWPPDALQAAVARAHAGGARVAVHSFSEMALPDVLAAGVDCIEHGTGVTEDLLATMVDQGTALVPTLINIDNFPGIADDAGRFPTYAAHMRALFATSRQRLLAAFDAGVAVYAGTDAGGSLRHGRLVDEIRALHAAGLPSEAALGAASWSARDWLGAGAGLSEGDPADLVVYPADPRLDLEVLAHPMRILLRGRVVA
ncbi:MAG: amidohydrolase family protein [Actinomycetota bacterium]|nr:amidohydrolase family protein [Actinomycetota bacterium]